MAVGETRSIVALLCHCRGSLSERLGYEELAVGLRQESDVEEVHILEGLCHESDLASVKALLEGRSGRSVLLGACSPKRLEPLYRNLLIDIGTNPHLLTVVNLREGCAWVTPDEHQARARAKVLLRQGLVRARGLIAIEEEPVRVSRRVLVVGSGGAARTAAEGLGEQGLETVHLSGAGTEKIVRLDGEVGDFRALIADADGVREETVGAVIVAEEGIEVFAEEEYGVVRGGRVLGLYELETMLDGAGAEDTSPFPWLEGRDRSIACMVLGLTGDDSRLALESAFASAGRLRREYGAEVYLVTREVEVSGGGLARLYGELRDEGILFFRYRLEEPPHLSMEGETPVVEVVDDYLRQADREPPKIRIPADLLVVEERIAPCPEIEEVAASLRINRGPGGFLQEDNVYLLPALSRRVGVFTVGTSRLPESEEEAAAEARGAVASVVELLGTGERSRVINRMEVTKGKCTLCLTCQRYCPHWAISYTRAPEIAPLACQACGICAAECPAFAIQLWNYTHDQIAEQLEAGADHPDEALSPRIVAFTCDHSGYESYDMAGAMRLALPPGLQIIRLPCSGKVDTHLILRAFEGGADGVLVFACHEDNCKFLHGNLRAEKRVAAMREVLDQVGVDGTRLEIHHLAANMGPKLAEIANGMAARLAEMGPSPLQESRAAVASLS